MDVRNCKKCGRIFNYISGPFYCQACRDEEENKFQNVKKYIRENPGVGVQEVAQECEVEKAQIYQWLREERLQLGEGSMISLSCETCGASISSGRFCENCKKEVANGLRAASRVEKAAPEPVKRQDSSSRMRFL